MRRSRNPAFRQVSGWFNPGSGKEIALQGWMGHRKLLGSLKDVPGHKAAEADRLDEEVFCQRAYKKGWVRFLVLMNPPRGGSDLEIYVSTSTEELAILAVRYLIPAYGHPDLLSVWIAGTDYLLHGRWINRWLIGDTPIQELEDQQTWTERRR